MSEYMYVCASFYEAGLYIYLGDNYHVMRSQGRGPGGRGGTAQVVGVSMKERHLVVYLATYKRNMDTLCHYKHVIV